MQRIALATLLGIALASSAVAQVPNVPQLLQGLTTGNQNQDQALRDAFERGYQRGRQDEARLQRGGDRGPGDRGFRGGDNGGYRNDRGPGPEQRQGGSYYGR